MALKTAFSLPQRFQIAETLAKAVWYLHTVGWLHKSVRSKNVAFFYDQDGRLNPSTLHVTGFEYSRLDSDHTELKGFDRDFEKNLYRHPDRQGPPTTRFRKLHDLYAVGLVLLEIGLAQTLSIIVSEALRQAAIERGKSLSLNPVRVMKIFKACAVGQVAHNMGASYASAVLLCLDGVEDSDSHSVNVYNNVVSKVSLDSLKDGFQ
jgi:hypothetical protein